MHGILSGDSALEKNKAGTRGRSARVLIRTNRKGLPERVASEQGRTGKASQREWHLSKDLKGGHQVLQADVPGKGTA